MAQVRGQPPLASQLGGLMARRDALRQAAKLPDSDARPMLEAALSELDAAIEVIAAGQTAGGTDEDNGDSVSTETLQAERQLLRATFASTPVALFLLEPDGTVRRVNRAAGDLLETGTGYATGKPFTAFVDLPSRAAVQSQLAATMRTGEARSLRCDLLTARGTRACELTASVVRLRGDADRVIIAASAVPAGSQRGQSTGGAVQAAPAPAPQPLAVAGLTRRLDLMTRMARLLLELATQGEAVTLRRCARLLASDLAAWVMVDLVRGRRLRRQVVVGPEDQRSAELARDVAALDPAPQSLPGVVFSSGSAQLTAHVEDAGLLGAGTTDVPLLMQLGATSVLSVPLGEGKRTYGVLTLARGAGQGPFEMADLGLIEELGEHVALAIKVDRAVRWNAEIAGALRGTLLPLELPAIPGVEVATAHIAASESQGLGGDFYDVYRTRTGWGVSIGDVGGRGDGVGAAGAAARHAIRVASLMPGGPAKVLSCANQVTLAEEFGGRFATAATAHLRWRGIDLKVTLASAGHPGPVLVKPDGRAQQMKGGGLPLGIFPDAEAEISDHILTEGDVLLFFTDGLADARNPELGDFGDRLPGELAALAARPPAAILARLREVVLDFSGADLRDDITMVALRVGEPPDTSG
jgi:serine phosphatase RsbU (regulator of sigma subunit)/PAS domain-containing protein